MGTGYEYRKGVRVLEKDIESKGIAYAKDQGVFPYKFTSPNRAAVPDRLYLAPIAPEHQELVSKYVRFVEYKRTGAQATASQKREHARLRAAGFVVHVVDNIEDSKLIADCMG